MLRLEIRSPFDDLRESSDLLIGGASRIDQQIVETIDFFSDFRSFAFEMLHLSLLVLQTVHLVLSGLFRRDLQRQQNYVQIACSSHRISTSAEFASFFSRSFCISSCDFSRSRVSKSAWLTARPSETRFRHPLADICKNERMLLNYLTHPVFPLASNVPVLCDVALAHTVLSHQVIKIVDLRVDDLVEGEGTIGRQ